MNLAISYINAGFALVPIPSGTKAPTGIGWNERSKVITTTEAASRINGNLGLAHAYCSPHPTVALDVDDYELSRAWLSQRNVDLQRLINADDSVLIDSGRLNRRKLLYKLPDDVGSLATVQYTDPVKKKMVIEFRCASKNGKTVQDVLPPSIHPDTGKPYKWAGRGHFSALPVVPKPLIGLWNELLSEERRTPYCTGNLPSAGLVGPLSPRSAALNSITRNLLNEPETPRRIAIVREMLSHINADCDYPKYRDVIWAVADTGWSCAYDLLRDWSLTAPHRFDEDVLVTILNSFTCSGGVHFGTLVHHSRAGGWCGS